MPTPLPTYIDVTQAPYSCIHDDSSTPPAATLNANRVGLQLAIDNCIAAGGGTIYVPAGWDLPFSRTTVAGASYGLKQDSNVHITWVADGATLRMHRTAGATDFFGLQIFGDGPHSFVGVTFSQRGMTTNVANQDMVRIGDGSENGASDIVFERCRFVNGIGGDGIHLLGFGDTGPSTIQDVKVVFCFFSACGRAAIATQRATKRVLVNGCSFEGSVGYDIYFDPSQDGLLGRFIITNNIFRRTTSSHAAISLSGGSDPDQNKRSIFSNNHIIDGTLSAQNLRSCVVEGNTIDFDMATSTTDAVLRLTGEANSIAISNNHLRRGNSVTAAGNVVLVTIDTIRPVDVRLIGNTISQETNESAIRFDSCVDSIVSENNIYMKVSTADAKHGINLAASGGSSSAIVCGNVIRCDGSGARGGNGVSIVANSSAPLGRTIVRDNRVENFEYGVRGTNPSDFAYFPLVDGNLFQSCGTAISNVGVYAVGGSLGSVVELVGSGDPQGTVAAPVGSRYTRTSNGAVYRKTSGSGTTGWTTP